MGRTPELFQENLTGVLNIACVIAGRGELPTDRDIKDQGASGRYWSREDKRFHLLPISNDFWAHIHEEGPTHMAISFKYRYDKKGVGDIMADIMVALFHETEVAPHE